MAFTGSQSIAAARGAGKAIDAFISYSREDSSALAVALQSSLERFAKPWYRLRAIRVFRDDTSMAANSDLEGTIQGALERSAWFILIASPRASSSRWVDTELAWWLEHRSVDTIMLVLGAGALTWDEAADHFDLSRSSALPPRLEMAYAREPRWIDLRWFGGPDRLGTSDPRFIERVADLAAPIHRRDRSDLVGENVRQHRRALLLARAGVALLIVLLALSLVTTRFALVQRAVADRERDAAVEQNRISVARQLAASASNLADTDLQQAALIAVEAHRLHPDAQTSAALFTTAAASPHLVRFLEAGAEVTATAGTPDARFVVAGTATGDVWRWDRETDQREHLLTRPAAVRRVLVSQDGGVVAAWSAANASDAGSSAIWRSGPVTEVEDEIVALSPSGRIVVAETAPPADEDTGSLSVRRDGREIVRVDGAGGAAWVVLPSERRMVLVSGGGPLAAYAIPSGRLVVKGAATSGAHPFTAAVDPTGRYVAVTNGAKDVEIDAVVALEPEESPQPAGFGRTESPSPTAFALSPGGRSLATAVDGRIWVGAVQKGASATPPAPQVLTGSGVARAETLRFLTQEILISAAGTAVSIWDLRQTSRLGERIAIPSYFGCNACGPGEVVVNPSGTRALVYPSTRSSADYVDFTAGTTETGTWGDGSLRHLVDAWVIWLDDDRLFAWHDRAGMAAVWSGASLQSLESSWEVPGQRRTDEFGGPDAVSLTRSDDGHVILVDGTGRVLVFDVDAREARLGPQLPWRDAFAVGLDDAGVRAWALTRSDDVGDQVTATVADAVSGSSTWTRAVAAGVSQGQLHGPELRLWGWPDGLLTVDAADGADRPSPSIPLKVDSRFAHHQPFAVYQSNGEVILHDTLVGRRVGAFPIPVEVYAWAEVGFSAGDQVLIVATAARDESGKGSIRQVRLGYDAWTRLNCTMAGRDLAAGEWRSLTDLAPPTDFSCRR